MKHPKDVSHIRFGFMIVLDIPVIFPSVLAEKMEGSSAVNILSCDSRRVHADTVWNIFSCDSRRVHADTVQKIRKRMKHEEDTFHRHLFDIAR